MKPGSGLGEKGMGPELDLGGKRRGGDTLGEGGPGQLPERRSGVAAMLGQTLAGQAGATGAWAALTAQIVEATGWVSVGTGCGGRKCSEPGKRGAWGPGCVVGTRPWCGLLTHLTSRCLCRSGPPPCPGSPGPMAPPPVGAQRAPQGCRWGSLGVTGGLSSSPLLWRLLRAVTGWIVQETGV